MKNIFKLLVLSLIFTACEDVEPTIYNGSSENPTFLSFDKTVYALPVVRDAEGTLTITLNSSTVSSVDRTYNLEIIDTELLTTADPATYDFPSSITIPAGSYTGTAVITGIDEGVDADLETIVFRISNINGEFMDTNEITINVFEVCPILDDFTGTYTLSQIGEGVGTPLIADGITVEVTADGEFGRMFTTGTYPAFGNQSREFSFNLACGEVILNGEIESGVFCTADNLITLGAAGPGQNGTYDAEDDSIIDLTILEDITGSCGAASLITIRLTKVE